MCISSAVAPIIAEIEEREYNTSDSITCSADGIPRPQVTWTRIAGSMPENMNGLTGRGQAVLMNLKDGDHMWMCTATNELGSTSVNVTFTGAFYAPSFCLVVFVTIRLLSVANWHLLSVIYFTLQLLHVQRFCKLCREKITTSE